MNVKYKMAKNNLIWIIGIALVALLIFSNTQKKETAYARGLYTSAFATQPDCETYKLARDGIVTDCIQATQSDVNCFNSRWGFPAATTAGQWVFMSCDSCGSLPYPTTEQEYEIFYKCFITKEWSSSSCSNAADLNTDCIVNWTEINAYIGEWLAARATWTEINNAIGIWLAGGY